MVETIICLTPQGPTCDLCILDVPWNISNGCWASLLNHTALKQKLCWPRCRLLSEINWPSEFLESVTEETRHQKCQRSKKQHQRWGFHYIAAVVFHKKCKQRLPDFLFGLTQLFLGVIYRCSVSSQLNSTHYLGEGWVLKEVMVVCLPVIPPVMGVLHLFDHKMEALATTFHTAT